MDWTEPIPDEVIALYVAGLTLPWPLGVPLFVKQSPHGKSIIDEVEYREFPQLKEITHVD